jgi:hypothetical protein
MDFNLTRQPYRSAIGGGYASPAFRTRHDHRPCAIGSPKAARYPSTRRDYQLPQEPDEWKGDQGNGQRHSPMSLSILHELRTMLLPAWHPNLIIWAVST